MSPALSPVVNPTAVQDSLPVFHHWQQSVPDHFSVLDHGTKFLLSDTNMFLELHPDGPRGFAKRTEYCVLSIIIYSVQMILPTEWRDGNPQRGGKTRDAKHVIKANTTGLYLCMNNQSIVYQSPNFTEPECSFTNEVKPTNLRQSYYRYSPEGRKWYLGLNKDGSIRCGNVTRKDQKSAQFTTVSANNPGDLTDTGPFQRQKAECCGKKCRKRNRKKNRGNKNGEGPKCRTFKTWCKNKRRRFFSLKLKDLKRYYRRCVKAKKNKSCEENT